jgi:hypothetical protein
MISFGDKSLCRISWMPNLLKGRGYRYSFAKTTHFKVCELTTSERGWSELRPLTLWIVF